MRAVWEAPRAVNCVAIALATGLGPIVVLGVCFTFVTGEAFWLIPTMLLGAPASALVGLIASIVVYRTEATRLSMLGTWLLATTALTRTVGLFRKGSTRSGPLVRNRADA